MTEKQTKAIAKMVANGGNITGKELKEIGYSDAIAHNPQKIIKAKAVKNELTPLLNKHNINLDRTLQIYSEAANATKTDHYTGEQLIDHTNRMKAADKFMKFLELAGQLNPETPTGIKEELKGLKKAIESGNEVELQRILFNKPKN